MRHAHSIKDIAELLRDYEVTILLTDKAIVEFVFPKTEKELKQIQDNQRKNDALYGDYHNSPKNIRFKRHTTYVIRSLVSNPRFARLTTVAGQLGNFRIVNNKDKNSRYGIIKEQKKAKENLQIKFTEQKFAKLFIKDIYKTGWYKDIYKISLWKKIKKWFSRQ